MVRKVSVSKRVAMTENYDHYGLITE